MDEIYLVIDHCLTFFDRVLPFHYAQYSDRGSFNLIDQLHHQINSSPRLSICSHRHWRKSFGLSTCVMFGLFWSVKGCKGIAIERYHWEITDENCQIMSLFGEDSFINNEALIVFEVIGVENLINEGLFGFWKDWQF